jgi:anthranilate phosphoribosyltransferase
MGLDGYDEISLTGAFKYFYNGGEQIADPADLGLPQVKYEDIGGGETVEDSAKIFIQILEGKGTEAQNSAVIANAGMALYCADQEKGVLNAVAKAKEALESGEALASFNNFLNR